jgi:hypothetical protein
VSVLLPPGTLPAWVNALAIGQWYEIPNTSISSVDPSPTPPGVEGPSAKVYDWTSFVADHRTSKVYSVANGGHAGYGGNEVDALELERDDPRWIEVLPPTPNASVTSCSEYYADGRPTSRHTYYGILLNEFDDRIMLAGGSWYCGNGIPFLQTIDSYNIGANSYSPAGTHPRFSRPFDIFAVAYTLDPFTGDIYAVQSGTTGRWNRSSNTFTADIGATGSVNSGGYASSAFDTTRRRIYVHGGDNNSHHLYTLSTNAWTAATLSGPEAATIAGAQQAALVYVPALDAYLLRRGGAGGTVYRINASTFEVTTLPTSGGSSIPSTQNGPFNKFLYLPNLRGAVYVPTYPGNAWFLRLH